MTPASRPVLIRQVLWDEPDYIVPVLVQENPAALAFYQSTMKRLLGSHEHTSSTPANPSQVSAISFPNRFSHPLLRRIRGFAQFPSQMDAPPLLYRSGRNLENIARRSFAGAAGFSKNWQIFWRALLDAQASGRNAILSGGGTLLRRDRLGSSPFQKYQRLI